MRLRLVGELDISTSGLLAERLAGLSEQGEVMLLDLDELGFIDASGARVIAEAAEAARQDGWSLTITRGSRPVQRLFQLLELTHTLPYDDGAAP
jgi:anti-anti-sigma factor